MRICVSLTGPYRGFRRRFEIEGDQIVPEEHAQLVIKDPLELQPQFLGIEPSGKEPTHVVVRWFANGAYLHQTFVGIPLLGLMDGGLGPPVESGMAGRYIQSHAFEEHFSNPNLLALLKDTSHHGPVSFTFSYHDLVRFQLGIPFWGVYAILEGIRGSTFAEWLASPTRLYESWCGALLVSRFPYPAEQRDSRTSVFGIEEQKVWMLGGEKHRDGYVTDETLIGVVSGRGGEGRGSLNDVGRKILHTCQQIKLEGIQYRTDMAEWVRGKWAELREFAIV